MKGSTKIILAAIGTFVLGATALVVFGLFVVWQLVEGTRLYNLGHENMLQRDYDGAIKNLTEASSKVLSGENRFWLYVNRGYAEMQKKRYDDAINDFTKAIKLNASNADPYEWRGEVYEAKKEPDKALTDYSRAIELDPNRGLAHSKRAQILFNRGEFDRAAADFKEVLRIWPNYSQAYLLLGRSHLQRGELESALADFDAYLRMIPSSRIGYEERAKVYRQQGDGERAFFDTAKVQYLASQKPFAPTKPKPQGGPVLGMLAGHDKFTLAPLPKPESSDPALVVTRYYSLMTEGTKAREAGDYDKAMELFNKALGLDLDAQRASTVMISRAACFWVKGEFEEAARAYDEATKLAPNSAAAHFYRATNFAQEGEIDRALKDYEEAIRLYPDDYRPYAYRGLALFYNGDFKDALIDFAKSLEISSTQDEAYQFRARLYMQQRELDKAIEDCSRAIEFHPESFYSYGMRARVYLRANKCDLAWDDLAKERTLASHEEILLHDDVAWLRATCRDPGMRNSTEALREAQRACEMVHWKHWFSLDVLATAEAEAGDFRKALDYEERALQMAVPPVLRPELQARLTLFQQHKPFRETAN